MVNWGSQQPPVYPWCLMVSQDRIERLVIAAVDGMNAEDDPNVTGSEIVLAAIALALRMLTSVKAQRPEMVQQLRAEAEMLWQELDLHSPMN